ncbi:MAG: non-ribosomal peptide synthetase, partial [Blastocatellia bacterium AA13]
KVQEKQSKVLEYEYSPLMEVQGWSEVPRSVPLFEMIYIFQNYPVDGGIREQAGAEFRISEARSVEKNNYPLVLHAMPGKELSLGFQYEVGEYKANNIERLLNHLTQVLESIAADNQLRVMDLSLMSPRERHQVIVDWNQTTAEYSKDCCVHELFEQQVKLTPEAVAVSYEGKHITYDVLNRRSNQAGRCLWNLGIGPESVVAIVADRGPGFLISMLATLKAGASYLPLDPALPIARLVYSLTRSKACVVLSILESVAEIDDKLSKGDCAVPLYTVENLFEFERDDQNLSSRNNSQNLAYLIYTSGSTGMPKGAMVEQRGMINHLFAKITDLALTGQDVVAQTASQLFDISIWQFLSALLVGGRVVIVKDEEAQDPAPLIRVLQEHGVSIAEVVPSLLQALFADLVKNGSTNPLTALRWMLVTGEAFPSELCRRWLDAFPEIHVMNAYGPTECSDDVTHYYANSLSNLNTSNVALGKAIANLQMYILNDALSPAPLDVKGELYVGGVGVGRGYLDDPAKTAQAFVPNPFSSSTGSRLYRTGDIGRYHDDGDIEYLGRIDHQVKIRGYRIELGEIEAAINEHAVVDQAIVLAREDEPGDKRLVCYFVGKHEVSGKLIREDLQERLPAYMMPAAFVQLEEMPLTANGKIDRRALRMPEISSTNESYVPPRSAVEEILCDIWSEVLRVEKVGITDNFFELGGHSLLAMQLVSRVRNTLGVEISLRSLFANPTVAAIAIEVEQLRRSGERTVIPPLTRSHRAETVPLSFAQQRLWFIDQLEPGNATYNIRCAVRLSGPLDVSALTRSLNEIVRRHEVLRTIFPAKDGAPRQEILETLELPLITTDLTQVNEAERERDLQEMLREEARSGFDLSNGPLIRAKLVWMAEDEHVLVVVMHHIISDGWSIEIMVAEFSRLYGAFAQGNLSPLPELEVQYADYSIWQREWLQGEVLETKLQYWKEKLDGVAVLELPSDRARLPRGSYIGASESFHISEELTAKLSDLSKREGATLFMSLLAGFQTLLARYSGQEDIAIGTPIAGRSWRESEGLIGCFVNTLVMRTDLRGNPTVVELLRKVRETALGAYSHQDVPFEKLVEELQPERSLSYQPLFQVMVAMQNVPQADSAIAGLTLRGESMRPASAKFELNLLMSEKDGEAHGAVEYATELYDGWRIRRLLEHFNRTLEGMVKNEKAKMMELPLMSFEERQEVIIEWNQTAVEFPADRCLHELFDQQVELTPDSVAVIQEDASLTYEELSRRANQLANYLREIGIGPDLRVGLCVERSLEMIVGLLGIMKAGAAYLPLDPDYPRERLEHMIGDGECSVTITVEPLIEKLRSIETEVVSLDADWQRIAQRSDKKPIVPINPENLAYVIFTSGSTGKPKGVAIEHRQILNYVAAIIERMGVKPRGKFAMVQPLTFDSCATVIYPALITGGCLNLVPREYVIDPQALSEYFSRLEIDCLKITPSHLVALQAGIDAESVLPRECLVIGGESSSSEWVAELRELRPHCRVLSHYGPTEATVGMLTYDVEQDRSEGYTAVVPVGHPLANTQAYVLDRLMQPAPVGVGGELYIAGSCIARGYLNHPEITADRFIPDLYSSERGGRLYKTGDQVRHLRSGNIEFLGRLDEQVKIRGYRIELGEIEAVLSQHASVEQVVVLAREDDFGERRLVAYLVLKDDVGEADLKAHLRQKLPDYMVPAAFIYLDEIPLMSNGKIDRRSLPKPDFAGAVASYAAPRTVVEEIVCGIWEEVLRLEKIGVTDNFFDLGGHSLLATQVVSRMRKVLGVDLALRSLFENPTVRQLSEVVMEDLRAGVRVESYDIVRVSRETELPLSYAQNRLWFMQELEPESWAYNVPTAVRMVGALDTAALKQSLSEIARRHEALRTSFESRGGEPVQLIHRTIDVEPAVVDIGVIAEGEQEKLAVEIAVAVAERPFDLKKGPVWRAVLVRLGQYDHVLVVCIHHVASDGWSGSVLVREFTDLYGLFRRGMQSSLRELDIQYADYAVWQRKWLDEEMLERQMDYWRRQLNGAPMLNLRKGEGAAQINGHKAGQVSFQITPEVTNELKALSRQEGATLFMTLLAAYQMVLGRYAEQDDVVVGTDIANRNRLEAEGLIGFFVNQLVLRVKLEGTLSFRELMARVRDVTLGANAHQDLPFEKLVEKLAPRRSTSRTPLFEASLVMQNVPQEGGTLEGLILLSFPIGEEIAKYTLALRVGESESGLGGALSYEMNVIHRADAELLVDQLQSLLGIVASEYDQSLDALGAKLDTLAREYRAKRKGSLKSALRTRLLAR